MNGLSERWSFPLLTRQNLRAPKFDVVVFALLFFVISRLTIVSAQDVKNVLILHEGNVNHPANVITSGIFHEIFGADSRNQVFEEYIDEDRLGASDDRLEEMLRNKYASTKMHLVIGDGRPAFTFLTERVDRVWPGASKLFYFVEARELPAQLPRNVTGVTMNLDFGAILDLALQLRPNARRLYYVGGVNSWEALWREFARQDFKRFEGKPQVTYLNDLPFAELTDRLGRLPNDSVVLYAELLRDVNGHVFVPGRACSVITSASSAPVFGPFDTYVGCGIVGGVIVDLRTIAQQTARLGLRILGQGTADGLPVEKASNTIVLDWRQLQRWGIDEKSIPHGADVEFRTPSRWEQDKSYLLGGITAFVLQLALIVVLILEIARRKKSELSNKDLSGRLINAGEEERKRLARELHDDIGQRLALVSLKLNMIDDDAPGTGVRGNLLKGPVQELDELVADVHNLSHQLHSTKLQALGLKVALRDVCQQLGRQYGVNVHLVADDVPLGLPEDIALCLYRVAQEALSNAVKYSRTNRIDLRLVGTNGSLGMTIMDYGTGFDTSAKSAGLGLATMRERMRLVGGQLSITSIPGEGTKVKAKVKLSHQLLQPRAAA